MRIADIYDPLLESSAHTVCVLSTLKVMLQALCFELHEDALV